MSPQYDADEPDPVRPADPRTEPVAEPEALGITTPDAVVAATGVPTRGAPAEGTPAEATPAAVEAVAGACDGDVAAGAVTPTVRAKAALAAPTPTTSAAIVQFDTCRSLRTPGSRGSPKDRSSGVRPNGGLLP